jgi:hypothetical protein
MLIEERELLGFWRWFEDDAPPVRHTVVRAKSGHLVQRLLAERLGQIGAVSIGLLVAR